MTSAVADLLSGVVAADAVLRGPERERWAVGGAVPGAVAFPATAEEAAAILSRASEEGWRVVPAGQGRWLEGGAPPGGPVELVLSTRRMDRILHYEAADLTISLEAGLEVDALTSRLEQEDQWLPLDAPGAGAGSVGALLATGATGPLEAGFGRPRDHVLGGTLVTGDGRILRLGGRVVKNVAGFDLVRLAVGSGGALGVLTDATLRLYPRPERDVTLRLPGPTPWALVEVARRVATAPVPLAAVELVDPAPDAPGPGAEREPALLVRVLGGADAVESVVGRVREVLDGSGGAEASRAEGPDSVALHRAMEEIEDGASLVVRLALPPARLEETMARAEDLVARAAAHGTGAFERSSEAQPVVAVHVTTGVVRVVVRRAIDGGETDEWARVLGELRADLEQSGGSLSVTSGPPDLVRAVGVRGEAGRQERRLLDGLKDAFDPAGVLPRVD